MNIDENESRSTTDGRCAIMIHVLSSFLPNGVQENIVIYRLTGRAGRLDLLTAVVFSMPDSSFFLPFAFRGFELAGVSGFDSAAVDAFPFPFAFLAFFFAGGDELTLLSGLLPSISAKMRFCAPPGISLVSPRAEAGPG
jgi:hypothetical protein